MADRGMKKWTSLMLPEHSARLEQWAQESSEERPPQPLMFWQLEELQQTIEIAYEQQRPILFTIFTNKQTLYKAGIIEQIDFIKEVILLTTKVKTEAIPFSSIQGAELDD